MLKDCLKFFLIVSIGVFFFIYGKKVPFSEQWILYQALRNTSAIIFGVMGAWLALLHPSGLLNLFGKQNQKNKDHQSVDPVNKLISPIVYSTFILIYVLVVGLFAPVLKTFLFLIEHKELLRGMSYSLISMVTVLQLWTLILTLVPSSMLNRDLTNQKMKRTLRKKLFSKTQNLEKDD